VSPVFVVWFTLTAVTALALAAVLIGLVRHLLGLGRTLRRFREEVTPVAQDISAEGDRASARAARLSEPRRAARSRPSR
jgi:hypothetical protein